MTGRNQGWQRALGAAAVAASFLCAGCGDCDDYLDEQPASPVTLTFRNETGSAIFLASPGTCNGQLLPYELTDGNGSPVELMLRACFTCEGRQEHEGMCPAMCSLAPMIQIDPGGSYPLAWDGRHYTQAEMPSHCYEGYEEDFCWQQAVVEDGPYSLVAHAYPEATGCDDDPCTCDATGQGWCQLDAFASPTGATIDATAGFAYPASAPIDVSFQ